MTNLVTQARRHFMRHTAQFAAAVALPALLAPAARTSVPDLRELALVHTHTHEKIDMVYASGERYVPGALGRLNRFLRDHYTGDIGVMDPQIYDQLHRVQQLLGSKDSFEVISGYRCPATNATNANLRQTRSGGVAKHSLHMEGRAIDVRLARCSAVRAAPSGAVAAGGWRGLLPARSVCASRHGPGAQLVVDPATLLGVRAACRPDSQTG